MAVAIAALVIAIAGTAVASVGTISGLTKSDKKQVRKIAGKVADQRIRSLASGLTVASAASAGTARVADTASVAASATIASDVSNQLWAVVNPDGTLFRASPGIVESSADEPGKYVVTADRDVSQCFYLAGLGGTTPNEGLKGDASANAVAGVPNSVYVLTTNGSGSVEGIQFTILIRC
jgi:predicted secreted protein